MKRGYLSGCAVALLLVTASADAGISADTTRIIFNASDTLRGKSVGLTSSAASPLPVLVNAQVTRDTRGEVRQVPFVTTPSLFRLEPDSTSQVLIKKTTGNLPQDRESLFWFRAVSMPAGQAGSLSPLPAVTGAIQVATATVIKLFYRPDGLDISQPQAMRSLTFSADPQGLKVTNPTPYYITLSSLRVNDTPVRLLPEEGSSMLAPHATVVYRGATRQGRVDWEAINDYGGTEVFHGAVQ